MAVIGIDLGTTNSLAAYWKDGEVELIQDEKGEVLVPSVVGYVENEGFLVGAEAKERLLTHSEATVGSFKRFMGTEKTYLLGTKHYTPMELSAMVLERIKKNAEHVLGEEIEEAIITVPAYFNDKQRSDTKKAAQIAGLHVERLINEPSAAALAYRKEFGEEDRSLLVFDFGGGTLDLSYVECFDNVIEIIAVAGDNYLGGDDVDRLIGERFCQENGLQQESLSPEAYAGLIQAAEEAKRTLETQETVEMTVETDRQIGKLLLDEDKLFHICMPLFAKIKQLFIHILEDADSRVSDLDDLIMVGGSSRLKVVRRFLRELLGKDPIVLGDTDKVVAMGAGVFAGIRQRKEEVRDLLLADVCPFTLGISVYNRAKPGKNIIMPMIERNSTLPAMREERLVTVYDYQDVINVRIYQGEEYYASDNVYLGEVSIRVEPMRAGKAGVLVRFAYDINGILHVMVTNDEGEQRQILLANQTLSDAELSRYMEEMQKVMLPPAQQPENQEMLNQLLNYYEISTGRKREWIGDVMLYFTKALYSNRKHVVKKAVEKVRSILEELESMVQTREEYLFDGELKWMAEEWEEEELEVEEDGE